MSITPTPPSDLSLNTVDTVSSRDDVRYFQARFSPEQFEFQDETFRDAVIMAHEYEMRRVLWWRTRQPILIALVVITLLSLLLWLIMLITGSGLAGLFLLLFGLGLIASLVFAVYCWISLPRLSYFGRHYRRFVATPLSQDGIVWSDPVKSPPDFPSLRDTFYSLYRNSDDISSQIKPDMREETERKKLLLSQLTRLLAPLMDTKANYGPTPFVPSKKVACLDRVNVVGISDADANKFAEKTLPPESVSSEKQPPSFSQLALDIEDYSGLDSTEFPTGNLNGEQPDLLLSISAHDLADKPDEGLVPFSLSDVTGESTAEASLSPENNQTLHEQITESVTRNLSLVERETERWRDNSEREHSFNQELVSKYKLTEDVVADGYSRIYTALEEEIRPAVEQLRSDTEFYRQQVINLYTGQRAMIETARDNALGKLERERQELEFQRDQRSDELSLVEAELSNLQARRAQLDASTDTRFESLKRQLHDLTNRTYSLTAPKYFQSDLAVPSTYTTAEEVLHGLAELRAETRLAINSANNSLTRYARIHFDPLDELGHLERELAESTKWQATAWLGNLINFRQSGQLLALASEVGESVSTFLEISQDFERMNERWCGLATAIQEMGLASYTARLEEAQQYLVDLNEALQSLYSSLIMAPHSPEMARPSTFQNIYDLAAGLKRELEELGGLAGAISHSQEQTATLDTQVTELENLLRQNESESNRVRNETASQLDEIARKQSSMLTKLDEFNHEREIKMREHIVALEQERDSRLADLQVGASIVKEVGEISEMLLKKHLSRTDNLLDEIHRLQQSLEKSLESIVAEFEQSILLERSMRTACELFVPVWLFEFKERHGLRKQTVIKAACYRSISLLADKTAATDKARQSFWSFFFSRHPVLYYLLEEDAELDELVDVRQLEPPATNDFNQDSAVLSNGIDSLVRVGWINVWLTPIIRQAAKIKR